MSVKNQNGKQIHENLQTAEKLNWWVIFIAVLALTFFSRYYKVTEPDHVCWDETHFGKMGSWYINRTFFFDVHPPLGKMLIGLSGLLTGYDGNYPFEKPGDKYNETRYEGMRIFCTTLGALVVPMAFDTVWDLTGSNKASIIAAAYLIFDVGMLTLNQYILLDPILLFFMVGSVWGMIKISKLTQMNESYTKSWWLWLFFTGTMLSCTISTKFVGLFVVLLVGLHTISELWTILGDLNKPITETIKQLICRGITLIIWPIILYITFFYIHLIVLNRSGNGDGFYSSGFQSRLIGNSLYNASMPREVAYGSIVTIKNRKTGGGYLHSHSHLYPKGVGSRQQQITTYTHKDYNNKWGVKHYDVESRPGVQILKHGDLVRLEHVPTRRNLHSHREPAPLTKKHHQVTGYGEDGVGDANDVWRIFIVGGKENDTVLTVTTKFILVHYLQNCALTSTGKQLPVWGFEQQEVTCNPNVRDKNAFWNVEENINENLPSVNFAIYGPGFFERFLESHAVMFQGNAGLKPKEGEVTSRPWQWPINYRGQFFSGPPYRIYLLGNPIIWWSNLMFLLLFLIVFFITAIKERRQEGHFNRKRIMMEKEEKDKIKIKEKIITELAEEEQQENRDDNIKTSKISKYSTILTDASTTKIISADTHKTEKGIQIRKYQKQQQQQQNQKLKQHDDSISTFSSNNDNIINEKGNGTDSKDIGRDPNLQQRKYQKNNNITDNSIKNSSVTGGTIIISKSAKNEQVDVKRKSLNAAAWLFIGWLFHYLPFWAMGRVLYFHHYFPALIFNSMLTGVMFNYITERLPSWLQHTILGPLANEPNSTMYGLNWMSTWEF
ncbi:protein O-mannosyl-transferase 2 isoform X2 [Condylostylus longicornis]|uniref:protein O-mannosyl-transferase 2 isoform X2 n=1 Tax=Condylostylus longicornis TaxID=2530218 RepID=UPI00244E0DFE|nr:protein O-mannosyl-transferase 2 isoform X2 [Condylostylus longicornis]